MRSQLLFRLFRQTILTSSAILGAALATTVAATAAEPAATGQAEFAETSSPKNATLLAQAAELAPSSGLTQTVGSQSHEQVQTTVSAAERLEQSLQDQTTAHHLETNLSAEPVSEVDPSALLGQIDRYSEGRIRQQAAQAQNLPMGQVTSVSQLSDVQPTDWAFQALQSLVERYGCIAGYPDGTYKGNRAMSRYEFAAGLNACLDRISELIAAATADLATKEDLATLQRLQDEFAAELATLRGRVDALEARTAEIEANQFSTTTKLIGEAVFALGGALTGDEIDVRGRDVEEVIAFGNRTRLNFETSFTGEDLLRVRLQADSFGALADSSTFTPEGDFFFAGGTDNDVVLDAMLYAFPIGDRTEAVIVTSAGASDDFAPTLNELDGDGGLGALTTFGTRAPIFLFLDGAGFGISHEVSDFLTIGAGYLAPESGNPVDGFGLFNGPYGAMGQLTFSPSDTFQFALTYINSYNTDIGSGSNRANFIGFTEELLGDAVPTINNSYGLEFTWRVSDRVVLGGWAGYTAASVLDDADGQIDRGDYDLLNWAVTLALPDLGKEGNLGGLIVGMEPRVIDSSVDLPGIRDDDESTSIHIEAFYQYRVNDNITITPAVIWLTAPDHDSDNGDIVIGAIRTTFEF